MAWAGRQHRILPYPYRIQRRQYAHEPFLELADRLDGDGFVALLICLDGLGS